MQDHPEVLNRCSMCSFESTSLNALTQHVCRVHKHHPRFIVYCKSCLRSYTKWNSYLRHLKRGCASTSDSFSDTGEGLTSMNNENGIGDERMTDDNGGITEFGDAYEKIEDTQWHQAAYILSIKEKYGLSQVAVDHIVESTKGLVAEVMNSFVNQISRHVPTDQLQHIRDEATKCSNDLFKDLSTSYLQTKYFESKFDYIEPRAITLGTTLRWQKQKGQKKIAREKITYQYVPILQSLKVLLKREDVLDEIENRQRSQDGSLLDFCDGNFVKTHPLCMNQRSLMLALYFDELEVANPLGSRRGKHKLGIFYWTLLNIQPHYRSKLYFIQLLAIVNSNDLKKFGIDAVLKKPVNDLKKLANNGITVDFNGRSYHYNGCVVAFLADTPAAALLGGFKEGVGGAYRCCRSCMVKKEQLDSKLRISDLRMRHLESHYMHCDLIESDGLEDHFSKKYGVNRLSVLNEIPHFNLCICLPHDVMHVILEGVLPRHMKLLLCYCIAEKKFFTLSALNTAVRNFQLIKSS